MSPANVRWGILGAGTIARSFAADLSLAGGVPAAVASRTFESASEFGRLFPACRVHTTIQDLLRDPEVDVIYVASPNARHAEHALRAFSHGKPVLCEKPFAMDADQARRVVAESRARRLFCMEAMWTRFFPAIQRVRRVVRDGAIGDVLSVTADFGYPASVESRSRLFDPGAGGGAWLDRGVYGVSLASMLLGKPDRVSGDAVIGPTGVDEQSTAVLHFSEGRLAVVSASLRTQASNEAWVMGSRGTIRIHAPFYAPERLTVSRFAPEEAAPAGLRTGMKARVAGKVRGFAPARRAYRTLRPALRELRPTVSAPVTGSGYHYEATEVARCLAEGALESPLMPLDETVTIIETLDAVRAHWGRGA